jgi:hypothetical protein
MADRVLFRSPFDPVLVAVASTGGGQSGPGSGASLSTAVRLDRALVGFTMPIQDQNKWCWAAVTVAVNRFFDRSSTLDQCHVADHQLGRADCCPKDATCNQAWDLDAALDGEGNLDPPVQGTIPFRQIRTRIGTAARPIACRVEYATGRGHFVAISGCRETDKNRWVLVEDPGRGAKIYHLWTTLKANFGGSAGAKWTDTYHTKPASVGSGAGSP